MHIHVYISESCCNVTFLILYCSSTIQCSLFLEQQIKTETLYMYNTITACLTKILICNWLHVQSTCLLCKSRAALALWLYTISGLQQTLSRVRVCSIICHLLVSSHLCCVIKHKYSYTISHSTRKRCLNINFTKTV